MCPNCRKMPSSTKANSTAKPWPPRPKQPLCHESRPMTSARPADRNHDSTGRPQSRRSMLPRICSGDRGSISPEAVLLGDVGKQHRLGPFSPSSVNDEPHPSSKAAWLGSMTMLQARGDSSSSADGFPSDGYCSTAQAAAKTAAGSLMSSPSALRRRRSKRAASSSLTRVEQGPAAEPMSPSKAAAPVRTFSSWLVMRFSSFSSTALVRVTLASAAARRASSTALVPVWSLSCCSARRLSRTGSNFVVDTAAEPTSSVGVASPRLSFASCRAKRLWRTGSSLDGESFGVLGEYRQGDGIILCRASSLDGVEHASSSFVRCFAQRAASTGSTGDSEAAPRSKGTAAYSRASTRPSSFARCRANQLASLGSMALPSRPRTHALLRERWMRRVPAH
mmetsp:Transcript_5200/g.12756  ORF Transcript_5200/g.12756 Transcript_5200/m.12756 type:complete len:393 (-) Transcript_5200:33-1211(-)